MQTNLARRIRFANALNGGSFHIIWHLRDLFSDEDNVPESDILHSYIYDLSQGLYYLQSYGVNPAGYANTLIGRMLYVWDMQFTDGQREIHADSHEFFQQVIVDSIQPTSTQLQKNMWLGVQNALADNIRLFQENYSR